jgi:hypothetical protein
LFRFVKFLLRALERCYGSITEIQATTPPIE